MSFEDLEVFFQQEIVLCEDALKHAKSIIGDTPVALDYLYHPRPLGLAKLLLTHDFNVTTIYLDSISAEEKEASEGELSESRITRYDSSEDACSPERK